MNMGIERWGFLFSVVSSPIVYFFKTTRAVCPNIKPIMLCAHVCDVNYAACYGEWSSKALQSVCKKPKYSSVLLVQYFTLISSSSMSYEMKHLLKQPRQTKENQYPKSEKSDLY